ncbi:hypothetical protein [Streptomyces sp. NBC_00986]|uniref:hypothetical protein n=1 Tax=Streptomyces sp. NBC_00986 TaxID=2903702 RepID=UPI003866CC51|nr:hypothetical protein OG504_20480 [Streptomyces sp. NBC_00986]
MRNGLGSESSIGIWLNWLGVRVDAREGQWADIVVHAAEPEIGRTWTLSTVAAVRV